MSPVAPIVELRPGESSTRLKPGWAFLHIIIFPKLIHGQVKRWPGPNESQTQPGFDHEFGH